MRTITLTLTDEQLAVIHGGLMKLPSEFCFPVIQAINQQLPPPSDSETEAAPRVDTAQAPRSRVSRAKKIAAPDK